MYLNQRAILQCVHGGQVVIVPMPMRSLHVMHSPVLTEQDLLKAVVVGCPQMGPGLKPCTKIVQVIVGQSFQIKVDQETPILDTLQAMTDGCPPGLVRALDNGQSNATPNLPSAQAAVFSSAAGSGAAFCEPCGRAAGERDAQARAARQEAADARWNAAKAAALPAPAKPDVKPLLSKDAKKPAVATGLGKDVDAIASQSPTLSNNITQLKRDGWTIKYGDAGKGTYADKTKKLIVVDANDKKKPAAVVQSLAHESGHALYTADPYVPPKGLTKEQYVKANVKRDLKDEGEATLMNIQVRNEIKKNKGPDIGIAGQQGATYEKIGAKYPDAKDRDKAREEIGQAFATGEHPSTDTSQTYEDYYRKPYADHYDQLHPPKKKVP